MLGSFFYLCTASLHTHRCEEYGTDGSPRHYKSWRRPATRFRPKNYLAIKPMLVEGQWECE